MEFFEILESMLIVTSTDLVGSGSDNLLNKCSATNATNSKCLDEANADAFFIDPMTLKETVCLMAPLQYEVV